MYSRQRQGSLSGQVGRGTIHPAALEAGTKVGEWRVLWRHGTGTFGVVYLAVRIGEEAAGPCALKLARSEGDARWGREVELLARVHHANVPQLRGHGEWYGFPYVVMDWVEGAVLYRWAQLCNPSHRQVARVLGKAASALAAVHAMGGTHRDMKGDNVLVRVPDGEPMLTDFGAGTWEGAAPLTVQGPPGTPLYYSPERLRAHLNLLPPGSPSGAGPADDVYGLGVTAFRLLTDSYPFLELDEAQRTEERLRGRLPLAAHEVNPRVPPELGALVARMMAARPEDRPPVSEVAQAMEALAQGQEKAGEELLFAWETEPSQLGPGRRLRSRMEYERWLARARIEEGQARVAAEVARAQAEENAPSLPDENEPPLSRRAFAGGGFRALPWRQVAWTQLVLVVLVAAGLGLMWQVAWRHSAHVAQVEAPEADEEPGLNPVGAGDAAIAAVSVPPSGDVSLEGQNLSADVPRKPLQGQKRAPCTPRWEVEINGGCWFQHATVKPPCGEGGYEWRGVCYMKVPGPERPTTSESP